MTRRTLKAGRRTVSASLFVVGTLLTTACTADQPLEASSSPNAPSTAVMPLSMSRGVGPEVAIAVTPGNPAVVVGGSIQLTATVTKSNGKEQPDRSLRWSSSKPAVATVDSVGVVQAVSVGTATISAATGGRNADTGSATVTVVPVATAQVNTTNGHGPSRQIGMFGAQPANTVFGQSFVVPSGMTTLKDFTFWLNAHPVWVPTITFAAYVMEWDGAKAVGPVLWRSAAFSGPTQWMQRYQFVAPGGVPVVAGKQYIAFLSTVEYLGTFPSNAQVLMGYEYTPYPAGRFYSIANAGDFSRLTSAPWQTDGGCMECDAAFVASFSNTRP